jgi:hypothetical protein
MIQLTPSGSQFAANPVVSAATPSKALKERQRVATLVLAQSK